MKNLIENFKTSHHKKKDKKSVNRFLNVGGGPNFNHEGWTNLDSALEETDKNWFVFSPECVLPVRDRQAEIVYCSHVFEHLDDGTIDRVLSEILRSMQDDADLVIKIHNFDATLANWSAGNLSYFSDQAWNFNACNWSWPSRQVLDTIDTRALQIFSGFWNSSFGNPFKEINKTSDAYFGPPTVSPDFVDQLFRNLSPHQIAKVLREHIRRNENDFTYSHQNAWSKKELAAVLINSGFESITFDSAEIIKSFRVIPGIDSMTDESLFCWAKRKKKLFFYSYFSRKLIRFGIESAPSSDALGELGLSVPSNWKEIYNDSMARGRPDEAEAICASLVKDKQDPSNGYQLYLAHSLFEKSGNSLEDSIQYYSASMSQYRKNPSFFNKIFMLQSAATHLNLKNESTFLSFIAAIEPAVQDLEVLSEMKGSLKRSKEKIPRELVDRCWNVYGDIARQLWEMRNSGTKINEVFVKEHFIRGEFPISLVEDFVSEILTSPIVPIEIKDSAEGYYFNDSTLVPLVETYNRIFSFRRPSERALTIISSCLRSISSQVTQCLRSSWRVVQTRYWETLSGGEGVGTNGWHTDGFPDDAIKILAFFSPVSEVLGSTMFEKVDGTIMTAEGPAGTWFLFKNSVVRHCGLPPLQPGARRMTVEITLAPALITNSQAIFSGTNGHFPYRPWLDQIE